MAGLSPQDQAILNKYKKPAQTNAPTPGMDSSFNALNQTDQSILSKYIKPSTIDTAFSKASEISRLPSIGARATARVGRVGSLATEGLIEDVPFIREAIPEKMENVEPYFGYEQPIKPLTTLARDVFLLKGLNKLGLGQKILRGAGIGMATANSSKPEEILWSGVKGAMALPILDKGTSVVTEKVIMPIVAKAMKSSRQMWQDLLRSGFMVEKESVKRAQEKGIKYLMDKSNRFRDADAFIKLADTIHTNAMKYRRYWGDKVGRWRAYVFRDPRIQIDIIGPRDTFVRELTKPGVSVPGQVSMFEPDVVKTLDDVKTILFSEGNIVTPEKVYMLIDKLDDMISRTRTGDLSLGKNAGRMVANLSRDLKNQVYKSLPRSIAQGLRATEQKFGKVAGITDDVFGKLQYTREGVAAKERIGAAELALRRGMKAGTPYEERMIWKTLDDALPQDLKFMEHYKDISAAYDFSQEGIGWLLRRLLLSPRMAAAGIQVTQPMMKAAGTALNVGGKIAQRVATPVIYRKTVPSGNSETGYNLQ